MTSNSRLIYLDNLRALMIVLMVVGHGVHPYKLDGGELCTIPSPTTTSFFNVISELGMSFRMPILFFLSAYFILKACQSKKTLAIIKNRFFRLGVPLLFGLLFISPLVMLIDLYVKPGDASLTFLSVWHEFYSKFWKGDALFHLWFLPVLLVFNVLTIILYQIINGKTAERVKTIFTVKNSLAFFFVAIVIYVATVYYFFERFTVFHIPPLLSMFAIPIASNISAYCIGLIACQKNIFSSLPIRFNRLWWSIPILMYAMHYSAWAYAYYFHDTVHLSASIFYGVSQATSNIVMVLFLFIFSKHYLNRSYRLLSEIRKHAFSIYLVHFPFVSLFQLMVYSLPIYSALKFLIVVTGSLLSSYLLCEWVIQYIPWLNGALYPYMVSKELGVSRFRARILKRA